MKPAALTCLVPGLLALAGDMGALPAAERPAVPALARILGLARREPRPGDSPEALALGLAGITVPPGADLPAAPLTWLADTGRPPPGPCLRADPVYLQVDQGDAVLLAWSELALTPEEAGELVSAINRHFAAAGGGWRLEAPHPHRWYLLAERLPRIRTTPLSLALGARVGPLLPAGDEARAWRAVLNEVQMLLHAHPVNAERLAREQLPVNGLWLWGGGDGLPRPAARFAALCGDDPLLAGLAAAGGMPAPGACPGQSSVWLAGAGGGHALAWLDGPWALARLQDTWGWVREVERLDRHWLGPALEAVRSGRLQRLVLVPGDGRRYTVTRRRLRAFWRRPRAPW